MSTAFTDSAVEQAAVAWLEATGRQVAQGPDMAPDMPAAEPQAPSRLRSLHDRPARFG